MRISARNQISSSIKLFFEIISLPESIVLPSPPPHFPCPVNKANRHPNKLKSWLGSSWTSQDDILVGQAGYDMHCMTKISLSIRIWNEINLCLSYRYIDSFIVIELQEKPQYAARRVPKLRSTIATYMLLSNANIGISLKLLGFLCIFSHRWNAV